MKVQVNWVRLRLNTLEWHVPRRPTSQFLIQKQYVDSVEVTCRPHKVKPTPTRVVERCQLPLFGWQGEAFAPKFSSNAAVVVGASKAFNK